MTGFSSSIVGFTINFCFISSKGFIIPVIIIQYLKLLYLSSKNNNYNNDTIF